MLLFISCQANHATIVQPCQNSEVEHNEEIHINETKVPEINGQFTASETCMYTHNQE